MEKKIFLSILFVLMLSIIAACGAQEGNSNQDSNQQGGGAAEGETMTIAVVPKLIGIPYFNASEMGAIEAGEALGVEVIYTGPTQPDATQQVRVIEDLISRGVDVIAVAPNDPDALTPVLQRAREEGIIVMDWDTPADPSVVQLSVKQIDDQQFAEHIFDLLVESMGTEEADFAIITGGLAAANINTWIDLGLEYASEKYPSLNLVTDRVPSDEQQQVAYQRGLELIRAYPDLKGIIGYSTPAPLGAAQAVQERGLQGEVAVVGTALPTDSLPYLEDGSLSVATLWDPEKLGYLTVYLAKELVNGNMPQDGDEVPGVGQIEVKEDGITVIMGPPTDFTAENARDYDF